MGFEELLDQVGGFGPFQLRNLVLMALPRILLPLHFFLPVFLAAVPSHHCALPGTPANISQRDLWLEAHLPREPDGTFSSCFHFAHPRALFNSTLRREVQSPGEPEGRTSTVPCSQGWEYDNSEFSSTIATEWDLVCEHRGLNKATSTLFFVGVLVGAVVFGYLSDRFGRRWPLLLAYVSSLVLGLASVASVNYVMFTITRTFTGLALAGFTVIVLSLELEWLDMEHRTVAGVLSSMFWSGGVMLLALVGYLIRDWRWLLLTVTLPFVPGIISMWWVPESARWLLTQGRVREAQSYLLRCAKLNGRPVGEDSLSMETLSKVAATERVVRRPSYLDLFRTPRLRHISLCCIVVWFGMNFSYYGLTLDLSGLGLNVYQTQLLFAVVELPSKLLVYLLVRCAGRRPTQVGMLVGTALTFGVQLLVPSDQILAHRPGSDRERFFFCRLHHGLPVHFRAVPYCAQADRDRAELTGGPAGRLLGTPGGLAGWSVAVTAQHCLWGDHSAGCHHCPPAARDEAGTTPRDHPGRGENKFPARCSGGRDEELSRAGHSPPQAALRQGLSAEGQAPATRAGGTEPLCLGLDLPVLV